MIEENRREPSFVALHGRATSLVLETPPDEAPLWRYWGPRLPEGAVPPSGLREARPTPSFSLDSDQPLSVFPAFGVGWFYQPALLAHRDGADFAHQPTASRIERNANTLRIVLDDAIAGLEIAVSLTLDPQSDVLTVSTVLTNRGEGVLDVQWLAAATLPLPGEAVRVRYYSGRHNREFEINEEALSRAIWRRENRRGLTSHDAFPGALALTAGAGEDHDLVYGAQLAWSGNHAQTIERVDDGRRQWQLGEWLAPGEVRLAPDETLHSPEVLATCSLSGANGVARNFHRAIRARMNWPGGAMKPRPVHLNTWEAFYFNHRPDELKSLAQDAARLGVERFVLDDGWFKGRDNDRSSLGDWTPDRKKYPDGLKPLVEHVTGLGMEFGLWVEPEMVNPDSDLFRAHPEWALQIKGRPLITGRNQLVLDLTRVGVSDYLFESISALLAALPIAYLKWDHNRDLTTAGDAAGRAAYRRQVLAAYALIDRLRAAHPDVEIEACAGGGGRIDAGILQRTHRFWASDCLDAVTRLSVQRGFLQFMPPEVMGSHVGAAPAHATGRAQAIEFRAGVAATGHFGLELDPRALEPNDRLALERWIAFYKHHRTVLHGGDVWRGDAGAGAVWQAHGSAQDLLVLIYRIEPTAERHPPNMKLPMLERNRAYRARYAVPPRLALFSGQSAFHQALAKDGAKIDGAWLAEAGLPMPPMHAESVVVLRLTAA
ncbi:MAG TPA: alpha-galactosidase [Parvularcula sp.]|nr:alpha-galactosidase [Parvularcula sp.]